MGCLETNELKNTLTFTHIAFYSIYNNNRIVIKYFPKCNALKQK